MSDETEARPALLPEEKRDILRSLRGATCPACGEDKRRRQSFCSACFRELPWSLKGGLYQRPRRANSGYYEAFWAALHALRCSLPDGSDALVMREPGAFVGGILVPLDGSLPGQPEDLPKVEP